MDTSTPTPTIRQRLGRDLSPKEIASRTVATFVAGAVASPINAIVFNVDWWMTASMAGITAVVNMLGRMAQRWLAAHPEDE